MERERENPLAMSAFLEIRWHWDHAVAIEFEELNFQLSSLFTVIPIMYCDECSVARRSWIERNVNWMEEKHWKYTLCILYLL